MTEKQKNNGFTLVELLLVIGIIATLAVVVFVALNPAKRFADTRNARRTTDIENILSAVHQYYVDNKGAFPEGVTETEVQIGSSNVGCELTYGDCSANLPYCANLSNVLSRYLKTMPFDPAAGSSEKTRYTITRNSNEIITIKACDSEGETISISR